MERYNRITNKNQREIVLLKSRPCAWGKCRFCDYIDDNSRDREELARLGECLGYLDASTQETTAALYLEELKREIERTNLEAPAKKKLYQSMGILGGIFLALLFF